MPSKQTRPDPLRISARAPGSKSIHVVIETPAGAGDKYARDPDSGFYKLRFTLPAGMAFPHDFGFVPGTLAGDGDPIDVMVLADHRLEQGCLLDARLIGVIRCRQWSEGRWVRNDRLIAVAHASRRFAHVHAFRDLPLELVKQWEEFFVQYSKLRGRRVALLGRRGAEEALRLVKRSTR